jgi:FeS assembly SUF system regulator
MLRISRLTDYGTVVMAYLANNMDQAHNAKDVAEHIHIAQPTVSKLLKLLARAGLLSAQRGVKGGYSLALSSKDISLAQIINAIEGNFALTECSHEQGACAVELSCAIRNNWRVINKALYDTFSAISLVQLAQTTPTRFKRQLESKR